MKIKLFLDTADLKQMQSFYESDQIQGFTTNPTLMRQAGIQNYLEYAKEVSERFAKLPLSLEVFADELDEMYEQAIKLSRLGKNIYVKIPITNTKGVSTAPIIKKLTNNSVPLNITAVFTVAQVNDILPALHQATPTIVSIFAGRIANAGLDPMPIIEQTVQQVRHLPKCEVLWASPREVFNVIQAEQVGCHIITMTPDLLKVLSNFGKDLTDYSLDTVKMFYNDAKAAGYVL